MSRQYEPLTAEEWLQRIVDTGAQRSGFARKALEQLRAGDDNALAVEETFLVLAQDCPHAPIYDLSRDVDALVQFREKVMLVLAEAECIDESNDPTADQVAAILRMFLPVSS